MRLTQTEQINFHSNKFSKFGFRSLIQAAIASALLAAISETLAGSLKTY